VSTTQLESYLASDEELLLSFRAEDVSRGGDDDDDTPDFSEMLGNQNASKYTFGATDRRVVYLDDSGAFKDIDYQHISSIESDVEEDNSEQGAGLALGCCGGFILLAGFGSLSDQPGTALFMVVGGIALVALAVKLFQNADTSEKQQIKFITGDEVHQQIEITLPSNADENVGAELSRILREQR